MEGNESKNNRCDGLKALSYFISTLKGNKEKLKKCSILRGNRGYFWKALDERFFSKRVTKKFLHEKIQEMMGILKMENQIFLSKANDHLKNQQDSDSSMNNNKIKIGKFWLKKYQLIKIEI
jgi:hypothetical protein